MSVRGFSTSEIAVYYAARAPLMRQRGRHWRGACPIHRGTHLSLSVNSETGCWRCFSECGRGGSLIDFEMEITGADFRTALNSVYSIVGRPQSGLMCWADYRLRQEQRRAADLEQRDAAYFASAARIVIEGELERLAPDSPEWGTWALLLRAIKDDAREVLRCLKQVDHRSAEAWVYVGRQHQRRVQLRLADFINRMASEELGNAV